jgi:hypothetical protein
MHSFHTRTHTPAHARARTRTRVHTHTLRAQAYALRFKKVGGPGQTTMTRTRGDKGVPNLQDKWTPLHSAARHGNCKVRGISGSCLEAA